MRLKKIWPMVLCIVFLASCSKDDASSPSTTATPTITDLSPNYGPVGWEFTITGTNFSTTATENTVKIGTVTATIVGNTTTTSIKATVPTGATTEKVSVTVGGKTGTSSENFIVTDDPVAVGDPPVIESQAFEAAEDIAETEIIGTLQASDPEGDDLTFSIAANDNGLFDITEADGILSLAEGRNLDFESNTEHTISVSVSDGSNSTTATVTITVTNVADTLAEDPNSFVTTWTTPSDSFELIIGTNNGLDYDFSIDWGDGTVENLSVLTEDPSHTYATAGTYTVAINGGFPAIQMYRFEVDELVPSQQALIGIEQWGAIAWENFNSAFGDCANLIEYNAEDVPDLSNVEDLSNMFYGATLFNGAIGGWDTTNVTDISGMFSGAENFNQDISNWVTSNVINMYGMFFRATSFNQPIGEWNTGRVTDMAHMFSGATKFNEYIGDWDTSEVTVMNNMFTDADSFNQDISTKNNGTSWNTALVTDMTAMFSGAEDFDQDIGNWNTSKVTQMVGMFNLAPSFNRNLENWDTSKVISMLLMFNGAESFDQNVGDWDLSSIAHMANMFDDSGMSSTNMNATLIGWADYVEQNGGPINLVVGMQGITVCGPEVDVAGMLLANDNGWQFPGLTNLPNCP